MRPISLKDFLKFGGEGYNRVPIIRQVSADLDTPLSVYMKLVSGPDSYLLESVHGGEKFGRYSFIGLPARKRIEVYKKNIMVIDKGDLIESHIGDPLNYIKKFISRYKVAPVDEILPRFCGGLAGYFGYDTIRYIEPRLGSSKATQKVADPNVPDILLMLTEELAVFDNLTGTLFLIVYADPTLKDSYSFNKAFQNNFCS